MATDATSAGIAKEGGMKREDVTDLFRMTGVDMERFAALLRKVAECEMVVEGGRVYAVKR